MPRSWPQPRTSRPSTVTLPTDAVSSPMAIRSAVVLPQPEGPMSETISPSCTVKLTRLSACTVCSAPSMRSVNRFDMSCRDPSPMPHPIEIQSPLPFDWVARGPAGPSLRENVFVKEMDCGVKPDNDDAKASLADARQRFLADIGVNQLV